MNKSKDKFLSDEDIELLSDYSHLYEKLEDQYSIYQFEQNETIITSTKPVENLYFILSGRAKVTLQHADGRRSIIHFAGPGELIGELTLIDIEDMPKDVTCITPCECIAIPMVFAIEHLLNDSVFMLDLCRHIGKKMMTRTMFLAKQQSFELRYRLARYILLTECDGYYRERHTETAEFLGSSYRHLLLTFQLFSQEGLITKCSGGYKINREKLLELSKKMD